MAKRKTKRTVFFKPFSKKYQEYYYRCLVNRINCLEGAYRAGKSVINILSFANHIEQCEDKFHLVTGYSSASARLNVSDCNGFGLRYIFDGRCRSGKYENNDCLYITDMKNRLKIVIFAGGGNSNSYKSIQGLSFGSWLSVELANLYISDDDRDFINMALSRLTQSKNQKVWWDLNPTYPAHQVYKKYLDSYYERQKQGIFPGGYNYMRCSLFDNTSLTPEQIQNALAMFPDPDSVDYKRNILGERTAAEGIIFSSFAIDPGKYVVENAKDYISRVVPQFISIGVDFGGNGSNTAFCASLICDGKSRVFVLRDHEIDMSKEENRSVLVYKRELIEFVKLLNSYRIAPVRYIFCDHEDSVMVSETKDCIRALGKEGLGGIRVENCRKHTILKRIKAKAALMQKGRYAIFRKAEHVITSTSTQVWDNRPGHEEERLDNHTCDIDIADAEEYSWSAFLTKLVPRSN